MDMCDENSRAATKPPGFRGLPMEGAKLAPGEALNNRRALRDIKNLVGAPLHPCAISKKELLEKKIKTEKKISIAITANRPITRRFAATLKSQIGGQDLSLAPQTSDGADDSIVIDIDDAHKQANDIVLPMIEDDMVSCELKEVEMQDLSEEETVIDIDSADLKNPLATVEYIDDIYKLYRQTEASGCVSPNYMSNQYDINERMRAILIDWLIEVHYKFELMDETLYLTVNIIDRFLERQTVVRKKLQLVGVTALLLACKYEEVSVPVVEDLILISDRAYTRDEVLQMEKSMVNTLQFNMSVPTAYVFMRRFLKAAQSDKKMELLSFFLIELCLVEYDMLSYPPSLLAAAAVYTAQSTLKGFKNWNKTCELHSNYTEGQLLECSKLMVDFHQKAAAGKLTGVHRKYSTFKFGCAAKSEPALFLLQDVWS